MHPDAKEVTLPDGRTVGNYSEEHRLYHEARWVITTLPDKHRDKNRMTKFKYLQAIELRRGRKAREQLREEMLRVHYHLKRQAKT